MGSTKIGRPKSKNPKAIDIKVRVDEKTYNDLLVYCEEHKINKASAIRRGLDLLLKTK